MLSYQSDFRGLFVMFFALFIHVATATQNACADEAVDGVQALLDLDFDELMSIPVITATREQGQELFTSPAAISVIESRDIRRSGLQSLPELMRLVPGMHVAQIDANKWSISARGFSNRFNKNMQVLMDGRTLYNPLFGGVIWANHDTVIEDINSIEVIRGPGGSLWGANAVNGVINIQTKTARETQGVLLTGQVDSNASSSGTFRYGGGDDDEGMHFRVYGKYANNDGFITYGPEYSDAFYRSKAGFRVDWDTDPDTMLTVQGDMYQSNAGETNRVVDLGTQVPSDVFMDSQGNGWNVLANFNHKLSATEHLNLKFYVDSWSLRARPDGMFFDLDILTVDLEAQHEFDLAEGHRVVWGVGYRNIGFDITNGGGATVFDPTARTEQTVSAFIQDTIELAPDSLDLIVGTKLDYNNITHFEIQPSARLAWSIDDRRYTWLGVSRAVRLPAVVNQSMTLNYGGDVQLLGNTEYGSEELVAYEWGFRQKLTSDWVMDLTAFYNDYDGTNGFSEFTPPLVSQQTNYGSAESYGFELMSTWTPTENLRLIGQYSFFRLLSHEDTPESDEGATPRNMASLRMELDLTNQLELNTAIYYNDILSGNQIPAYIRLDVGLTWHASDQWDLSIIGQNLSDSSHKEFDADGFISNGAAEIQRAVIFKATWNF